MQQSCRQAGVRRPRAGRRSASSRAVGSRPSSPCRCARRDDADVVRDRRLAGRDGGRAAGLRRPARLQRDRAAPCRGCPRLAGLPSCLPWQRSCADGYPLTVHGVDDGVGEQHAGDLAARQAPPRTPDAVSWVAVHAAGPVGGRRRGRGGGGAGELVDGGGGGGVVADVVGRGGREVGVLRGVDGGVEPARPRRARCSPARWSPGRAGGRTGRRRRAARRGRARRERRPVTVSAAASASRDCVNCRSAGRSSTAGWPASAAGSARSCDHIARQALLPVRLPQLLRLPAGRPLRQRAAEVDLRLAVTTPVSEM